MLYKKPTSRFWHCAYYVRSPEGKLIKRVLSTKKEDRKEAEAFETDIKKALHDLKESKRIEIHLMQSANMISSKHIKSSGLPLTLVWDKYSEDPSQKNRTERTQSTKRIIWNKFLSWIAAEYSEVENLNDVSRDICDRYLTLLKEKSSSTFNNHKNTMSGIWHVLTVKAGLTENPWRLFKGAENKSVRHRSFSVDEMKLILKNTIGFWHDAVIVSYYSGLRFKDVVYLKRSQVKTDFIELIPSKTQRKGKDVRIFIHPDLRKVLDRLLALNPSEQYLFPEAVSSYNNSDFQSFFGNILRTLNIADNDEGNVGFHSLRHSFVTAAEEIGIDRKVISGIVGHGSTSMTGHYSHDKKSGKAIEQLPSILEE